MNALFKEWKLFVILGLIITLLGQHIYYRHKLTAADAERRKQVAAEGQAIWKECQSDNKLTQEQTSEYQKKIDDLNMQLAADELRGATCVDIALPPSSPASGNPGASGAAKHDEPHGVTSSALYAFAADAERYRLQLASCQDFVKKAWAANGQ